MLLQLNEPKPHLLFKTVLNWQSWQTQNLKVLPHGMLTQVTGCQMSGSCKEHWHSWHDWSAKYCQHKYIISKKHHVLFHHVVSLDDATTYAHQALEQTVWLKSPLPPPTQLTPPTIISSLYRSVAYQRGPLITVLSPQFASEPLGSFK